MIFAVDFDGTICKMAFPDIGEEIGGAINTLTDLQAAGHKIIIWTCRCYPLISPMIDWLGNKGFKPDAVNSNLYRVEGFAVPKIHADYYLDDKSFPPFSGWKEVRKAFLKEVN